MGPGQYPQYTPVWLAREAVGSSQTKHDSTNRTTTNEPILHETMKSRMVAERQLRSHGSRVTANVTERSFRSQMTSDGVLDSLLSRRFATRQAVVDTVGRDGAQLYRAW